MNSMTRSEIGTCFPLTIFSDIWRTGYITGHVEEPTTNETQVTETQFTVNVSYANQSERKDMKTNTKAAEYAAKINDYAETLVPDTHSHTIIVWERGIMDKDTELATCGREKGIPVLEIAMVIEMVNRRTTELTRKILSSHASNN